MNATDTPTEKTPIRAALEDSLIMAGISLVSGLVAVSALGLPDVTLLYTTGMPAALMFLTTYAIKRGIMKEREQ